MPVTNATYQALVRENEYLNRRIDNLEHDNNSLRLRNGQVLPMVRYARESFQPVFGELVEVTSDASDEFLSSQGVPEHRLDDYLVFAPKDENGLAMVWFNPAKRAINVSDPNGVVDSVQVTIDDNGELDSYEIKAIRDFQAAVLFARQYGNGYTGGRVSLVNRPARPVAADSATPVDEPAVADNTSSEDSSAPQA